MKYHIIAFAAGFILDLLLGDPHSFPHPVRLIGKLIAKTEKRLSGGKLEWENGRRAQSELRQGVWLVILVLSATVIVSAGILYAAYLCHPYFGMLIEAVMTYQILAVKCLKTESMRVYKSLKKEGLEEAKKAVSMIVGRDTAVLDEKGVARAAIETVAENTSDGVIAPMLYTALGGPVLGFFYKAVNTMDSMVGYKNDKYLYFGRAAARLDDWVNYIPARISAYLMILAVFVRAASGEEDMDGKRAYRIYKRDRRKHASPNSAQTEAVCAGALGIRLAGDAVYFGKVVEKPYIGEALREVEYEDIKRVNQLMYLTAWSCELLCLSFMAAVSVFF